MNKSTLLRSNLDALCQRFPEMGVIVRGAGPLPGATCIPVKAGGYTLTALDQMGDPVLMASKYDPAREADRAVSGMLFDVAETLVVKGFGLGYHLLEMKRRLQENHYVLVLEPEPRMVFEAFQYLDLTGVLLDPHFDFFFGMDMAELLTKFTRVYRAFFAQRALMVEHPPSLRLNRPFFDRVAEQIMRAQTFTIVDLSTQVEHGRLFQANAVANIEAVAKAHAISPLENAYRGIPGICVAAGPSLTKNMSLLAELRDRCVVTTVDTALLPLIKAGVRPDVVAAIDPHPATVSFISGAEEFDDVCLLFDQEVCPQVPALFKGRRLVCDISANIPRWTQRVIGQKGEIPKGITVAHTAFFLLRYLGCDPIVFLGLDLAFPGGRTHVKGSVKSWGGSVDGYLRTSGVKSRQVRDIFGRSLITLTNFESFQTRFEAEISKTEATVIDATEGGARIRGTQVMKLREVIARYLSASGQPKREIESLLEPPVSDGSPRRIAGAMSQLIGRLKGMHELYQRALSGLDRLEGQDPQKPPPFCAEVQQVIQQILAEEETMKLLEFDMTRQYIAFMADPGSLPQIAGNPTELVSQASRVHGFLSGAVRAIELLSKDLTRAVDRFRGDNGNGGQR